MGQHFHNRDMEPGGMQRLRHFHANVAGAYDECLGGMLGFKEGADGHGVRNGAKGKDARIVHAGQRRAHRLGPGAEQQLIVPLLVAAARGMVHDGDGLAVAVDIHRFGKDAHIHSKAGGKAFRRLYGKLGAVADLTAYIIR